MSPELAIAILELALDKGVPAVIGIMQAWEKEEITLDDIRDLREGIGPPETYLNDG